MGFFVYNLTHIVRQLFVDLVSMKRYLFIILLVGVCFGQDAYPYFSDMAKQLEFERNKIVIEEGEETQQIIAGGGSQFNWLSIISEREPLYLNAPIVTKYNYLSYFNIMIDGKEISEVQMLKKIGLEDEVNRIISNYKKEILDYEKSLKELNEKSTFDYKTNRQTTNMFSIGGGSLLIIGTIFESSGMQFAGGIFLLISVLTEQEKYNYDTKKSAKVALKKKNKPVLKQQLTEVQIKSMAEAYNRKLYSDIANK